MSTLRTPPMDAPRSTFGRALVVAVVMELLVIVGWVAYRYLVPPVTIGLQQTPTLVHMVTLPPKVKPHPLPKPPPLPPKPVVKPQPRPLPPVHHRVPLPRLAPKPVVVPPRPIPPPPPMNPATAAQAVDRYGVMLRTRIQTGLRVPGEVRALGLSGAAIIRFKLTPAGTLLWARVGRSSGFGPIDRACLAAVEARTYPPFTAHMPHHPMIFNVIVSMRQKRN
ncbi:MAG: cell envelope integrity protein TolA [Acidiferrobacter sp.]